MSFCTQCGKQLLEGQACECTEVKQFCTECGAKLFGGKVCACTAKPVSEHSANYVSESDNADPEAGAAYDGMQIISDYVSFMSDEIPVRQYNLVNLRNWIRVKSAEGRLLVTNKRLIFRAEGRGAKWPVHREIALSEITGIDAVSKRRFSFPHMMIGLVTVLAIAVLIAVITFMGGWAITTLFVSRPPVLDFFRQSLDQIIESHEADVSQLSLIFGLFIGFGGVALYFLLRMKYWFRQLLLGVSLGAFFVVGLTGNVFANVLFGASVIINIYGLVMFARLPDLFVSVYGKGGTCVNMIQAKNMVRSGYVGMGCAEAAPTPETSAAICELGAVIADLQNLDDAGVMKWSV